MATTTGFCYLLNFKRKLGSVNHKIRKLSSSRVAVEMKTTLQSKSPAKEPPKSEPNILPKAWKDWFQEKTADVADVGEFFVSKVWMVGNSAPSEIPIKKRKIPSNQILETNPCGKYMITAKR